MVFYDSQHDFSLEAAYSRTGWYNRHVFFCFFLLFIYIYIT